MIAWSAGESDPTFRGTVCMIYINKVLYHFCGRAWTVLCRGFVGWKTFVRKFVDTMRPDNVIVWIAMLCVSCRCANCFVLNGFRHANP